MFGKSGVERIEKENILQAVIILDSFCNNFAPISNSLPECLLPLANRPLLSYTLELLASAGVEEAILFCSNFTDSIKEFVKSQNWPGLVTTFVVSEGCRSLGDAMRDIDAKAMIRSDFILLTGNVIGNLNLLQIVEKHKRISKIDKGIAMTLIYKECGARWKAPQDDILLAMDNKTGRLILHKKLLSKHSKIDIPLEICLENDEIDLRYDLYNTNICICSITVPPLFSDNFDFQTQNDFLYGLLVNEEILTSTVYCHILSDGQYVASPSSWYRYQDITHDVIHRWTFPQVPDSVINDPYFFRRNNIYIQKGITLSQSCILEKDSIIGSGCEVGHKTNIISSVLGKNCKVGDNVLLEGSYLMEDVTIETGCVISHSVIGAECVIKAGAKISKGSVLGQGVVVQANTEIVGLKLEGSSDSVDSKDDTITSKSISYQISNENDSLSDSDSDLVAQALTGLRLTTDTDLEEYYEETSDSDDDATRNNSPIPDDTNLFYSEVVDSLVRGYEDKVLCDNLVLEINSSRYAYNVSLQEVTFNVVRALLTLTSLEETATKYWQQLIPRIQYFLPILKNYINNAHAQSHCLSAIEDILESHEHLVPVSPKLIHLLYDKDILCEEVILKWYNSSSEEDSKKLRLQVKPFIQWLLEADEQSDDEEED
uniref:Translation initiation factor eIF2B subunit epsilon n=2 Tax=Clastoptera arizonana TaxID=38151 RepID=A0A1B6C3B5_9HEMI